MKDKGFEMVRYDMHGKVVGQSPKLWERIKCFVLIVLLLPIILAFLPEIVMAVTQDDIER